MYFVDVLALKLRDKRRKTLFISLDTDGFENGLDVLLGGRGVAAEGEEEVCCEVLHFAGCTKRGCQCLLLVMLCERDFEVEVVDAMRKRKETGERQGLLWVLFWG
jgi:hypothetical protein